MAQHVVCHAECGVHSSFLIANAKQTIVGDNYQGVYLVDQVLNEHDAIRTLIKLGQAMSADDARSFAALLEKHIRFEERELFDEAQRVLNVDERKALMDASSRA